MPTYRQTKIKHDKHVMATYTDGKFRFCRYYLCGYTEAWDTREECWVPFFARTNRRKPPAQILREKLAEQLDMFPAMPRFPVARRRRRLA